MMYLNSRTKNNLNIQSQSHCWWVLSILCALIGANPAACDDSPPLQQIALTQLGNEIQRHVEDGVLDGVSVGIVDRRGLRWSQGFGYANRSKDIRANTNTIYRAGSLSKLLTATAVLQLEELELIDIDQALSAFIPAFGYKSRFSNTDAITPRHLLTHLAGLPSNINKGHWTDERFDTVLQRLRMEYTAYPTDFILNYSNIGYSMLGVLIEENSDYLFEEFIQHHIFDPLRMTDSNFAPYGSTADSSALGYNNGRTQRNLPIRDIPALGLNTSVQDLSHFIAAILNQGRYGPHEMLMPSTVESMFAVQNSHVELDYDDQIGIPWFLERDAVSGLLLAEHGGTTINFSSQVTLAPERDLGVIMLSNSTRQNTLLKKLARSLLRELLEPTATSTPRSTPALAIEPIKPARGKRLYVAQSGILELDQGNSALCECHSNKTINLTPLSDGWLGLSTGARGSADKLSAQNVAGKEVIVLERNGKRHRIGSRFAPEDNPFTWNQHFGSYEIINQDEGFPVTDVEIFSEVGATYLCYRMPQLSDKLIVLPITPLSQSEALIEGLGRARGETLYIREIDGLQYLIYSGYVARKNPAETVQ